MASKSITLAVADVIVDVGSARLLDGVSFECCAGEWTLLYGPSGSGKSTLLRTINGLHHPSEGTVMALDAWIPGRSRRQARSVWRQTGTVLQEIALFETKTSRQNVELALRSNGLDRATARKRAVDWLGRVRLGDKVDDYPASLSGGERQRVALARAFAREPRLLLLDEPTSALDRDTARTVIDCIKELTRNGATVLMSSHRIDEISGHCDQRIALQNGRVFRVERAAN